MHGGMVMSSTPKDHDKILTLILTHKPKPLHMFIISLYNLPFNKIHAKSGDHNIDHHNHNLDSAARIG